MGVQRQVSGTAVALVGAFGHAAGDYRVEVGRHVGPRQTGTRNGLNQAGANQFAEDLGDVRRRRGQALVQHTGQGINVGARCDLGLPEPLGAMYCQLPTGAPVFVTPKS
jgi:hypothetical protein